MNKLVKIFLHIFFWTMYVLFAGAMSFELKEGISFIFTHFKVFLLNGLWAAIAFYTIYFYGYKYFENRTYFLYFILVTIFSLALTICFFILYKFIIFPTNDILNHIYFFTGLPGTFVIANCGSLLRGFIAWFDAVNHKSELEKSNLKHELDSLHAQINPHLFTLYRRKPQKVF